MPRPPADACAAVPADRVRRDGLFYLLLCAKHLFVAALVSWVHPGPAAAAGQSAFEPVKYSGEGQQKQITSLLPPGYPPFIGKSTLVPLPPVQNCCFAPNTCSSLP